MHVYQKSYQSIHHYLGFVNISTKVIGYSLPGSKDSKTASKTAKTTIIVKTACKTMESVKTAVERSWSSFRANHFALIHEM